MSASCIAAQLSLCLTAKNILIRFFTYFFRYKAEVDVDGRELAKYYLKKNNVQLMLKDVQTIQDERELELFLLKHGENICLLYTSPSPRDS